MVVTISSPDKLSIAMFLNFLIRNLGSGYVVGEVHSLMSEQSINSYVDGHLQTHPKVVFTYYAKRKVNIDPVKVIPPKLLEVSEAVVWFNMYETSYKSLKDTIDFDKLFLDTWNKNLVQLGEERR